VVLTEENTVKDKRHFNEVPFDKNATLHERIEDLELELLNTKQNLQAAVEQLEASNEELQSTNEELLSANEELQSTNEELQSLNEELHTVNAEHQIKIKELVELNDDLNNYFRSTYIAQVFVDNDLIIRKFTPAAQDHVNLIDADIGRPITHISNNIKYPLLINDVRVCVSDATVINKEVENLNGKWYQMKIFPYIRQDKSINGVVISFIDVTTLKTALNELQVAHRKIQEINSELEKRVEERTRELSAAKDELTITNENLRKINTDLDNFVYAASHDLKAPINNIEGLVGAMSELLSEKSEEVNQMLGFIKLSIERFKETIRDLSDITKIQKEITEDFESIDLNQLVDEIRFDIRDLISKENGKLIIDIKEPSIKFSKKNLRSIIYNLLSNAFKYSHPSRNPAVYFSTEKRENFILITVKDNGLGIPDRKKDNVFGMFKRFHHNIEGSGVGLYIVKRIVDNSGGKIEFETEENIGTTFRVYLRN
jgi:two-component system CheB/CheR fusion protein